MRIKTPKPMNPMAPMQPAPDDELQRFAAELPDQPSVRIGQTAQDAVEDEITAALLRARGSRKPSNRR